MEALSRPGPVRGGSGPGVDVEAILAPQRVASLRTLRELNRAKYSGAADGPEELAWSLVVDSMIFQVEAQVRWLDHTEQRLRLTPIAPIALDDEPARRGRPTKVTTS